MTAAAVKLAAAQLTELEVLSEGALTVLDEPRDGGADFVIAIATGVPAGGPGIQVRLRERFRIRLTATFPYEPPSVWVGHERWRDSPHVQQGSLLCLYAAPSVEWVPADGMRGLVERLLLWLGRAAEGTLDPDDQPLHAPVTYLTASGCVVVEPSLGDRVPWFGAGGGGVTRQVAWCVRDGDRVNVIAWLTWHQLVERVDRTGSRSTDSQGRPYFVAPLVVISGELGWEYPSGSDELAEGLADAGYSRDQFFDDLALTSTANQLLRSRSAPPHTDDPVLVLVGTPSRRITGDVRLAHIVAWKLDPSGEDLVKHLAIDSIGTYTRKESARLRAWAREWLSASAVRWMPVHDQRSETTRRRDRETPVSWLRGRRVLVLGCGALGAPTAEHCVRAGADAVTVVDNGVVTPGILVRQPYTYSDVGKDKAEALTDHLNTITRKPRVRGLVADAIAFVLDDLDVTDFDLIVDATANSGVRAAIERAHRDHAADGVRLPHSAMMIIGHRSDVGLVTVSRSGATGTGHDVVRRVLLWGRRTGTRGWREVADDFFPDPPRTDMFLPEPGCSAPTFVGSAADVGVLAGSMLTELTRILGAAEDSTAMMTAVAVRGPSRVTEVLSWPNDLVVPDIGTGHDVRLSAAAMAEIRAEVRRGARVRGPRVETGGMLLGTVDESTGVISVDLATGPAPDSVLSTSFFFNGTTGTQELIERFSQQTGGVTGFLGIWHTHPGGPARPSQMDKDGMASLTTFTPDIHRALMVIIGGGQETWDAWTEAGERPDVHVEVVESDPTTLPLADKHVVPFGQHFVGGFSMPAADPLPRRRRRWLWWWKR